MTSTVGITCTDCRRKGHKKIKLRGPGIFKLGCALCKGPWVEIVITNIDAHIVSSRKDDNIWGMFDDRVLKEVD